ncbi:hypothetical protein KUTeg_020841 [Tegillarca granosa]|uniref:Protein kinase domain-containing protein n=1 Tax=Tegillarca granosa TaxID=220873 RepID=A0ABQ9E941_TEGGR|nr:hypothetical protein KUTeg_020841 [Tegillarca granosa]
MEEGKRQNFFLWISINVNVESSLTYCVELNINHKTAISVYNSSSQVLSVVAMPARFSDEAIDDMMTEGIEDLSGKQVVPIRKHNLRQRFTLIKTLGEGTYGKVKLAKDRSTGEEVAIKYIKKTKIHDDVDLGRIRREIRIMSSLSHPHIINVREVFENKDKIILVMEYAKGGELYDYINDRHRLSEKEARQLYRQIVSAIHHCHEIADFGLSNYYSFNSTLSTYCGSPLYASPEIVNGQPYHGPEVDCWSLGVILYTLVYGAMPFDSSDFKVLRKQISSGDYFEPAQPSEAAGLIRHLLTVNPAKRAKMDDILNHWWVNLGYRETPSMQPYPSPEILKPVSARHNASLSSDSEGENDTNNKNDKKQPLKGILKKPKTSSTGTSSDDPLVSPDSRSKVPFQPVIGHNNSATNSIGNTDFVRVAESGPEVFCTGSDISVSGDESKKVFDSEKKPARGILKRKGKFSGGDSGCILNEVGNKSPSSDSKENDRDMNTYNLSDIENALRPVEKSNNECLCQSSASDFVSTKNSDNTTDIDASVAAVPRRSILKKTSQSDNRKRLSACSVGSNSSADILDFSYDSSDENCIHISKCLQEYRNGNLSGEENSETYNRLEFCQSPRSKNPSGQSNAADDSGLFDPEEARHLYKQALEISRKM